MGLRRRPAGSLAGQVTRLCGGGRRPGNGKTAPAPDDLGTGRIGPSDDLGTERFVLPIGADRRAGRPELAVARGAAIAGQGPSAGSIKPDLLIGTVAHFTVLGRQAAPRQIAGYCIRWYSLADAIMRAFCRIAARGGCDAVRGWPAEAPGGARRFRWLRRFPWLRRFRCLRRFRWLRRFRRLRRFRWRRPGLAGAATGARWARSGGGGYSHDQFGLLTLAAPPTGIRPGQGDTRHVFA